MIGTVDEGLCDGCGVCVENCPVCILRVENGRVRVTKPDLCTDCRICGEVCPKQVVETS